MRKRKLSEFEVVVERGGIIYREGEPADRMYYIREGKIKLSISRNGHEKVLSVLTDGAFFGETALIDGKPRIATATAIEPTELLIVDEGSFESNLASNPVLSHILKTVIARMRNIAELYYEKETERHESSYKL